MAFVLLFIIYFVGVGLKLYAMVDRHKRILSELYGDLLKIGSVTLISSSLVSFLFIYGTVDSYTAKVNVTR